MWKYIAAALLLLIGTSDFARAANCSSYPYTLTNGQTADANQVMSNFNSILSCGDSNLLGKNNNLSDVQSAATSRSNISAAQSGTNSDITSLTGLTTPLPISEGGTASTTASGARTALGLGASAVEGLSNSTVQAIIDDGSGNLKTTNWPQLHRKTYTSGSNTFTVPSNATTSTIFTFTGCGGGGGGGGTGTGGNGNAGGGGGSAACGVYTLSGFTASSSVTIVIGSAGAAGSNSGGDGGSGVDTVVTYSATAILTFGKGSGGAGATGGGGGVGGAAGSMSASLGGVTTVDSYTVPGTTGTVGGYLGSSIAIGGAGGGSLFGGGGAGQIAGNASHVGGITPSSFGAGGGSGADSTGSHGQSGGAGGGGIVSIAWVL